MTQLSTPQDLLQLVPEFSNEEREVLEWLSTETNEELENRYEVCKKGHVECSPRARTLYRLSEWLTFPALLFGMALSVQFFSRLITLTNPACFPNMLITLAAFAAVAGLVWVVVTSADKAERRNWYSMMDGLCTVVPARAERLRRMALRSDNAKIWIDHVVESRQGRFRELDRKMIESLVNKDRKTVEPVARERVYQYAASSEVRDSSVSLNAMLEDAAELARARGLTDSKVQELLRESDESLARTFEENQKRRDGYSPFPKNLTLLENVVRFLDRNLGRSALALSAPLLAVVLWRVVFLTSSPIVLNYLAGLGAGLDVLVLWGITVLYQRPPEEIENAQHRVKELAVLDDAGCWEVLQFVKESPSALRWHHHVIHTQKRLLRRLDRDLMEAFVLNERFCA